MRPLLPPFWFVAAKSISPRPPTSLLDSLFLSVNRQSVVPCSVQQDSHVPLSPRNTFIETGCATQLNLNETMENRGRGIKEEVGGRLFFLTFFSSFYLIFIFLLLKIFWDVDFRFRLHRNIMGIFKFFLWFVIRGFSINSCIDFYEIYPRK